MAQKNILNKVKTAQGYDTLYPLTPYQIIASTSVSGTGSPYNVVIPFPVDNMTIPIRISFVANVDAPANATISINGGTAVAITGNVSGVVQANDRLVILYDLTNSKCFLLDIENKSALQQQKASGTIVFSSDTITFTSPDGNTTVTTFNSDGSITEVISQGGISVTDTTIFNNDGSITEVIS